MVWAASSSLNKTNRLIPTATLNATLTGQSMQIAQKLTDDRFSVTLKNGQIMLITGSGEILSEITGATDVTPRSWSPPTRSTTIR